MGDSSWLMAFFNDAAEAKLCHQCHCSTCYFWPFRRGLRVAAASASRGRWRARFAWRWRLERLHRLEHGRPWFHPGYKVEPWTEQQVVAVATALVGLTTVDTIVHFVPTKRVIEDLRYGLHRNDFHEMVAVKLRGTPTGLILDGIEAHEAAIERKASEERRELEEKAAQERAMRRQAKCDERARKHALRLEAKKVRDAIWQMGRS